MIQYYIFIHGFVVIFFSTLNMNRRPCTYSGKIYLPKLVDNSLTLFFT